MMKSSVLRTTRAVDNNFSLLSLDINPVHSSLNSLTVQAHFTYRTSCNDRKISCKPELVFFCCRSREFGEKYKREKNPDYFIDRNSYARRIVLDSGERERGARNSFSKSCLLQLHTSNSATEPGATAVTTILSKL